MCMAWDGIKVYIQSLGMKEEGSVGFEGNHKGMSISSFHHEGSQIPLSIEASTTLSGRSKENHHTYKHTIP